MPTKLQKYDKYKPSGLDWLGDIPQGWEVRRVKDLILTNQKTLTNNTDLSLEIKYIDIANVGIGVLNFEPETISFKDAPSRARRIPKKDDVIISTVRTYLKSSYYFEYIDKNIICSTGFSVMTPKKIIPKFLKNTVLADYFIDFIGRNSKGVSYPAIGDNEILNLPIFNPPIQTQIAIAKYLDTQTTNIDREIELLTAKASKYQQLKQTLISRVVTKGLDKSAKLKPSGVEWIGDIPQGWEVRRLKDTNIKFQTGKIDVNAYDPDGKYPFFTCSKYPTTINTFAFDKEALLIAGNGEVGNTIYYKGKFNAYQRTYIVTNFRQINVFFLKYFIDSLFVKSIENQKKGSVIDFIKIDHLTNFFVSVPPLQIQREIADYLDEQTSKIDQIITTINTKITKLKEYRKVLINDVVTGRVRVEN